MPDVCAHGNLKRQCELCQRDDEIANLRLELTAKDMYYSKQCSELRAELASSGSIREAEKKILIDEVAKNAALVAELAAYKKAKSENDERFMLERDEARAECARLRKSMARANEILDDGLTSKSLKSAWDAFCVLENALAA